MDDPPVSCALCQNKLETVETRMPFTAKEDIIFVNCKRCGRMIYARRESRIIEDAKWKARA